MSDPGGGAPAFADVARLYLGNVLYALEVTALGLQEQDKLEDAAFYRGIARELAAAFGREGAAPRPPSAE